MRPLLFGLLLAAVIYLATDGHVLFLPLLFLLPLTFMGGRRRRRRSATPFGFFMRRRRRVHRWP